MAYVLERLDYSSVEIAMSLSEPGHLLPELDLGFGSGAAELEDYRCRDCSVA
jgi:hypothetical protein